MAGRPLPIWASLIIGAGILVTGVGIALAALDEVDLDCTRETCTVTHSFPASRAETSLAGIRGAERTYSGGKSKTTHLTLIDERGGQRRLLTIHNGDVGVLVAQMQALLAGQRDRVVHHQGRQIPLLVSAIVMFVVGPLWLLFAARRGRGSTAAKVEHAPPAATAAPVGGWTTRRWIYVMVGFALVSVVANIAMLNVAPRAGGKLTITAKQRCEYRGITMLPGAEMEQVVDPGEHTIRVWAPDAPGQWTEHHVTVELGGDVKFVCAPP